MLLEHGDLRFAAPAVKCFGHGRRLRSGFEPASLAPKMSLASRRLRRGTDVACGGADEAAGLLLLHRMREPAGAPREREDRRKARARQAHSLEQERGVELDIRLEH